MPPTVQVTTRYPGASARTVIDTVALPIEQQVNGVEGMLYMQSYAGADGSYTLTVTFDIGTDLNFAQVLVQNRVSSALSSLPQAVQVQGVTVQKKSTAILQIVTLTSPDARYDSLYLSNYATIRLKDEIARLPGVGNVSVFGAGQYSMRVWLDPDKLQARGLTPQDVIQALQQQSEQVTAGQIGAPPAPDNQSFQYTLNVLGRLDDAGAVRRRDRQDRHRRRHHAGARRRPGRARRPDLQPGLHPRRQAGGRPRDLPVAGRQRARASPTRSSAKMKALAARVPAGARLRRPVRHHQVRQRSRSTRSTRRCIEAAILVLIVILVFLQDWRAMLVPATTVPVTIIGAFAAMAALGFTVNLSTLFAIVLAIGIVVDDAIVVVEGAAHNIEQGMSGHDAAIRAMDELFGPIIGITLVLMAVFLPAAFLPGLTGRMYAQFALVIAATALLSAINAATLKPTQCAMWLRRPVPPEQRNVVLSRLQRASMRALERGYARLIGRMVGRSGADGGARARDHRGSSVYGFTRVPTGFLPIEDQGYLLASVQLPDGASLERTQKVLDRVTEIAKQDAGRRPGRHHRRRLGARQQRAARQCRRRLHHPQGLERARQGRGPAVALSSASTARSARSRRRASLVLPPPPIQGIGNAAGVTMQIELRDGSFDLAKLQSIVDAIVANAADASRASSA